ncbi:MAG: hypothetical protein C0399_09745 [Syntrophus sp. (in: bacteria)]|nr:hypothetical protein [Syntrophus sp. (in: bacteria)]
MRKRSKFIIAAIVAIGSICLAISLASVSLYGENRKIDDVVSTFFEKIKNKQYQDVCLDLSGDNQKTFFSTSGQCSDSVFLFELSLLKHYNLLNNDSYRVEVRRTHFWMPFSQDRSMRVNIALEGENKSSVDKTLSIKNLFNFVKAHFTAEPRSDSRFVKDLLTVERRNGVWMIRGINIDNNGIGSEYAELKGQLRLGRYVREISDGFIIERVEVNAKDLTPVDKRVLKYNLQKVQNLIGN